MEANTSLACFTLVAPLARSKASMAESNELKRALSRPFCCWDLVSIVDTQVAAARTRCSAQAVPEEVSAYRHKQTNTHSASAEPVHPWNYFAKVSAHSQFPFPSHAYPISISDSRKSRWVNTGRRRWPPLSLFVLTGSTAFTLHSLIVTSSSYICRLHLPPWVVFTSNRGSATRA